MTESNVDNGLQTQAQSAPGRLRAQVVVLLFFSVARFACFVGGLSSRVAGRWRRGGGRWVSSRLGRVGSGRASRRIFRSIGHVGSRLPVGGVGSDLVTRVESDLYAGRSDLGRIDRSGVMCSASRSLCREIACRLDSGEERGLLDGVRDSSRRPASA